MVTAAVKTMLSILCSSIVIFGATSAEAKSGVERSRTKSTKTHSSKAIKIAGRPMLKKGEHLLRHANARKTVLPHKLTKVAKGTRQAVVAMAKKPAPTPVSSHAPALQSNALLVLDQKTGAVLFEKNSDTAKPIASLTKLMTAMVSLDKQLPLGQEIEIRPEDVDHYRNSASRLEVGTKLPRSEILRLALMSSENRAAHALARTYPGGVTAFVQAMNEKAKALGLQKSNFVDPTGLYAENIASAVDLAKIVAAASSYPLIRQYSTDTDSSVQVASNKTQVFRNTNPLIRLSKWDIAVSKTGYIHEAGRCLVMNAKINKRPTLIVLLDGSRKETRIQDAMSIKSWLERKPFKQTV